MVKKITNENLLGQRGINLIEECVLAMGFAWHPTNQAVEAGIDGHIELRNPDTEQALNLVVAVQSKARTDFAGETADSFTFYCDQRDIDYWMQGNAPVILIVSRPDAREAFWVNVKQHFSDSAARQAKKIVFDKTRDCFDRNVRDRLFAIARPRDSGLYLAPLPKTEQLLPNLLQAILPADRICFADTACRDPKQVIAAFQATSTHPGSDWVLYGGQVISFQRLDQPTWSSVCDAASVLDQPTSRFAESEDPDERRLFVRLLTRCLEAMCRGHDIRFDSRRNLFYFAATEKLRTRVIRFKSTARQSSRTVFEAYRDKETKKVRFCRHLAFEGYFRRLDTEWYLEVTPTYLFTRVSFSFAHNAPPAGHRQICASFHLNYPRPRAFALEAECQVGWFVEEFGLLVRDPQASPPHGRHSAKRLLRSWEACNQMLTRGSRTRRRSVPKWPPSPNRALLAA